MSLVAAEDAKFAVVALSAVLFVVDPIVAVPIFLSITAGDSAEARARMAARASLATLATLCFFAAAGGVIFRLFGISLGAFKIAGGIMLLLMALDMMRAKNSPTRSTPEEQEESAAKEDVAIVPMAIPMLAGPGAIATVMVLMSKAAGRPLQSASVFGAIIVTVSITWLLLRGAIRTHRFLSKTVSHALERVMGLLLSAVAVEFMVGGLRDLLPTLRG